MFMSLAGKILFNFSDFRKTKSCMRMSSLKELGESDRIEPYADPMHDAKQAMYAIEKHLCKTGQFDQARNKLCGLYRLVEDRYNREMGYKAPLGNVMRDIQSEIWYSFHRQRLLEVRPIVIMIGLFKRRTRRLVRKHFWRPLVGIPTPPPVYFPPTDTEKYTVQLLASEARQILSVQPERKVDNDKMVEYAESLLRQKLRKAAIIVLGVDLKRRRGGDDSKIAYVNRLFIIWFAKVIFNYPIAQKPDIRIGYL